jgi:Rhodopirellula transposase DDE domain
MNWRGRPLASHEVLVELIGAATTHPGLRGRSPLGVKVRDEELAAVPLARHAFHGEWNYSMQPAAGTPPPTASSSSTTLEAWM